MTDSAPLLFREAFRVRAGETGAGGALRLPALCDWLQEAAGNHAAALGFGAADLQARGLAWVLSRLTLHVASLPRWGETAEVETWPSGAHRLWSLRDFRVKNARGRTLATATSGWLVLRMESKRPIRPFPEVLALAAEAPARAIPDEFAELPAPEAAAHEDVDDARAFRVGRYDVDTNGHANNVSLLRWLFESLPEAPAAPLESSVDFRGEAFEGDALDARVTRDGRVVRHALFRRGDGRELVRALTTASADGV